MEWRVAQVPLKPAWEQREWKWANSEKTIENQRERDLTWHRLRKQKMTRPTETQRQSIRRRMKERASLAGASGWLWLFNALINPLLKAMQSVSGFVLWPRDYSAINKGWAGNIEEIPPPLLCSLAVSQQGRRQRWQAAKNLSAYITLVYMSEHVRQTPENTRTVLYVWGMCG